MIGVNSDVYAAYLSWKLVSVPVGPSASGDDYPFGSTRRRYIKRFTVTLFSAVSFP